MPLKSQIRMVLPCLRFAKGCFSKGSITTSIGIRP